MPFWSTLSRVERIIKTVPAYAGLSPVEISLDEFMAKWLPGLEKDGLLIGVNWSGARATGYDLEPARLKKSIEYYLANRPTDGGPISPGP